MNMKKDSFSLATRNMCCEQTGAIFYKHGNSLKLVKFNDFISSVEKVTFDNFVLCNVKRNY